MSDTHSEKAAISPAVQDWLIGIVQETLGAFAEVADTARTQLSGLRVAAPDVFAAMNTMTEAKATVALASLTDERRRDLYQLCREPAVARVVAVDDQGRTTTFFITRATPPLRTAKGAEIASYRSPVGRLAALPVGSYETVRIPRGTRNFEVLERAALRPALAGTDWDAVDSTLEGEGCGILTVRSFRALLRPAVPEEVDALEQWLEDARAASNVIQGLQRALIKSMGLRDQPVLDRFQDDVFRLPLDSRLVLLGPPGSGKTTTLIKRLGLKLDSEHLDQDERELVAHSAAGHDGHTSSWIMFTPTELLKLYVKEAFNREGIAASDLRIRTWADYRRELARNRLGILRTATGSGYVLKETLASLTAVAVARQRDWFEDFETWHNRVFWEDLQAQAQVLAANSDTEVAALGARMMEMVAGQTGHARTAALVGLVALGKEIQGLVVRLRSDVDERVRRILNFELRRDRAFLDDLQGFVAKLQDVPDEVDDETEDEEEDEARQPRVDREAAFESYVRAVRALSRAEVSGRRLGAQSRHGRLVEWLGERMPPVADLVAIGRGLQVQFSLRRFASPVRRYVEQIPGRYRRFRREQEREGRKIWYHAGSFGAADLAPLEADVIVLAMLRAARVLLQDPRVGRNLDAAAFGVLGKVRELFRTQVVVDEATDFSPVQLACMAELCDPEVRSFLACGDFNQRITAWGSRSVEDLQWVLPDMNVRHIVISYRHSRRLNDLARRLALLSSPEAAPAELPQHTENDGVAPVCGFGLAGHEDCSAWLAHRITEIERLTGELPTVAVLVCGEGDVAPVAASLDATLADRNIRAVPCPNGQAVGQDNDVRVFNVRHIKGLEFEAVFFVDLDRLAEQEPDLFDKYLYVGTTRAATYLGLTVQGSSLPDRIAHLAECFRASWSQGDL